MGEPTDTPRIGVSSYREPARWGVWNETADLLPASYSRAIEDAGGVPMLLPPMAPRLAAAALDGVDGLLLAGGADVEPALYGAERDEHTGPARADRDAWELALAGEALTRDLPVLAICRGMQLLNVALGGALLQHLPDEVGSDDHCPTVGEHGRHVVELEAKSRLAAVLGPRPGVATYHHQAVRTLGQGLRACGWATDGIVEAVEHPDRRWVLGVQWHPEEHEGQACSPPSSPPVQVRHDRQRRGALGAQPVLAGPGAQRLRGDHRTAGAQHPARRAGGG